MWQREGAVRLFVEHVILFNDQDDYASSESVVRLWKVQCFVMYKLKANGSKRKREMHQRNIVK